MFPLNLELSSCRALLRAMCHLMLPGLQRRDVARVQGGGEEGEGDAGGQEEEGGEEEGAL